MLRVKLIILLLTMLFSAVSSAVTEIKCYVELTGEIEHIYVLSVAESDIDMAAHKKEILGTELSYQSARKNKRIVKVNECRLNDDSFVNIKAIKLDEARDR